MCVCPKASACCSSIIYEPLCALLHAECGIVVCRRMVQAFEIGAHEGSELSSLLNHCIRPHDGISGCVLCGPVVLFNTLAIHNSVAETWRHS
jgi:hypothetical protein